MFIHYFIYSVQVHTRGILTMEALIHEVKLMAVLKHDCICSVRGYSILDDDSVNLVLENVPEGDLYKYLRKEHAWSLVNFPWSYRLNMCLHAARAVNYLHSLIPPVLHRDIKSQNFLVADSTTQSLKLTDFGTANLLELVSDDYVGTLQWSAPEVLGKPSKWSASADIYSLGMVFYEIATNTTPFGENEPGLTKRIIEGARPYIPDNVPEVFWLCYCLC